MWKSSKKHKIFQKLEESLNWLSPKRERDWLQWDEAAEGGHSQITRTLYTCQGPEDFLFCLFFIPSPPSTESSEFDSACIWLSLALSLLLSTASWSPVSPSFLHMKTPGRSSQASLPQHYSRALILSSYQLCLLGPAAFSMQSVLLLFFSLLVQIYSRILPLLMFQYRVRTDCVIPPKDVGH